MDPSEKWVYKDGLHLETRATSGKMGNTVKKWATFGKMGHIVKMA